MRRTHRHALVVRRAARLGAAALLAATCLSLGGCRSLGYVGYLLAPEAPQKTVPAEFEGLAGRTVAVVIFSDERVQYEYPYARLTLASAIRAELISRLKNTTVVDPGRVCRYQDEHINWEAMDKTALAKDLGADYVLQVALVEYTTREPGSVNLFRGRITAQAGVYQADLPERSARVWWCDNISVVNPKDNPVGLVGDGDRQIRGATERLFADALVKNFYAHKAPK